MPGLKAGDWQAEVCPEFGMNLTSLAWRGQPILRVPKDMDALRAEPFLYGNPLLFPANRTKDGCFRFRGKTCALPVNEPERRNNLHGLMYDAPFSVLWHTESSVCAVFRNRGERYPFAFDLTIADILSDSGWVRRAELLALEDMPFTLAFHTTFLTPKVFSVPIGRRFVCDENYIPTGETVPAQPLGKVISGFYEAAGHTVFLDDFSFTVSENFDQWVLFNGGGDRGFLCIEPQCGGVNGLNTHTHRVLRTGEKEEFTLQLTRTCP